MKPKPVPGGKVNTPDYYHYYYSQPLGGPPRTFNTTNQAPSTPTPTQSRVSGTTTIDVKGYLLDVLKFTKEIVKKKIEFGAVFVVLTGFALIYFNLGERKKGEESAYNVFNKNHRELLGTLNARQFENELMSRHNE